MRSRILVIPAVDSIDDFAPLMCHVSHYMAHVEPERIVVLVDRAIEAEARAWLDAPRVPDGFDERAATRTRQLGDLVQLESWPTRLERLLVASDIVLDWHVERSARAPWASVRGKYRINRTLMEIDWERRRLGASWLAELAKVLTNGYEFDARKAQSQVMDLVAKHGQAERAYLLATGPSARAALEHDLTDGVRIACNTFILDDELMAHADPDVVTFADPIFHFGPSTYAQRFQDALVARAQEYDFTIVTTERFAPLLRAHAPTLRDRVVGLRQGRTNWPTNFDLEYEPGVKPYPNILTMLMLPIATTLARSAELFGFDGRDPDENYFWKHGRTVQFGTEMEDIRKVHPGFFEVDYEDYYENHLRDLHLITTKLATHGFDVRPATHTHMTPLRRRVAPTPTSRVATTEPVVISLTPDWTDEFGHFGPMERRLHAAAAARGVEYRTFASSGLLDPDDWQERAFSEPSYGSQPKRFTEELRDGVARAAPPDGSVVAFYTADVWHLPGVLRVATEFPHLHLVVNLMRSHPWIDDAMRRPDATARAKAGLLRDCLEAAEGTNVEIVVDTDPLAGDVATLTGRRPRTWPMVAVSNAAERPLRDRAEGAPFRVVAPVHAQVAKGFAQTVALAERLAPRIGRGEVEFLARFVGGGISPSRNLADLADRFEAAGGQLVRDNLSDDDYVDLVADADVVLVPYRVRPFRTRTSGVVLDALLSATPVVAARGTWAGQLVDRLGAGATYNDDSVMQLEEAVAQVETHLEDHRATLLGQRDQLVHAFDPARLIDFLLPADGRPDAQPPAPEAVARIESATATVDDLLRMEDERVTKRTLAQVVRDDYHYRRHDTQQDEIAILRRGIAYRDGRGRPPEPEPLPDQPSRLHVHFPRSSHAHVDEVELVAVFLEQAGRGPGRMVDVGAHAGSALRHFHSRGWLVHAFEADREKADALQARFEGDDRVSVDARAVADVTGEERTLYTSDVSSGISGLSAFHESHVASGSVETVRLVDALPDDHVEVLKVDTEGYDKFVLEGYPWDRDRPDVVVCEFEDAKTTPLGYTTEDFGNWLLDRGYEVWVSEWHPIVRYGIRHDWHRLVRYPCDLSSPDAWGNFIAFREPVSEAALAAALAATLEHDGPQEEAAASPPSSASTRRRPTSVDMTSADGRATAGRGSAARRDRPARTSRAAALTSRSSGLRWALRGSLMLPVVVAALGLALALVAAVAAPGLGVVALVVASAATLLSVLVLAVRLERRTRSGRGRGDVGS